MLGEDTLSLETHLREYESILNELDNLEPRTDSAEDYFEVLEKHCENVVKTKLNQWKKMKSAEIHWNLLYKYNVSER